MAIQPIFQKGIDILALSYRVQASVTSYIPKSAAAQPGVLPYRVVILNSASGTGIGDAGMPEVRLPSSAFTNGEHVLGISMDPVNTLQASVYQYAADYYPTLPGQPINVRLMGVGPVQCDSTVVGTPIAIGDYVAVSATANYEGCIKKAAKTGNAFSASQHVVGIAMSPGRAAYGSTLVFIARGEV